MVAVSIEVLLSLSLSPFKSIDVNAYSTVRVRYREKKEKGKRGGRARKNSRSIHPINLIWSFFVALFLVVAAAFADNV